MKMRFLGRALPHDFTNDAVLGFFEERRFSNKMCSDVGSIPAGLKIKIFAHHCHGYSLCALYWAVQQQHLHSQWRIQDKTRKPCYRIGDRAMRHTCAWPGQFRKSLATPMATIAEIVNGLLLRWIV